MLLVISPAKALNLAPPPFAATATQPRCAADTKALIKTARGLSARKIGALMGISPALAKLNHERFQAFDPESEEGLQAAFAFNGDVYLGLKARELDAAALAWAQDHLRILSGLYGLLRPLDVIQPYRLEMGSRLKTRRGANLYEFWGDRIAKTLNAELAGHADPTLVNVASHEYFAAVDKRALKRPSVTCHFQQDRGGVLKPLGFAAKRGRGQLARFAIDGRIDRAEDLKAFDVDGYSFRPGASSDSDWIFARKAR